MDDTDTQTARRPWAIVTPLLTVLAVLLVLFGPIATTSTSEGSSASGLVDDLNPLAVFVLVVVTLAGLAAGLSYWRGRLGVVGFSSVILCLGVVVTLPSIGLFFLPAAVVSVVTWIILCRKAATEYRRNPAT